MKTLASALVLCTMALATSAMAKDADNLEAVTVRGADMSKESSVSRGLWREVGGDYLLSNGQTLTITREQNHLYAQFPGMQKTALFSTGNLQFASADHGIAIQFTPQPIQSLTRVKVSFNMTAP